MTETERFLNAQLDMDPLLTVEHYMYNLDHVPDKHKYQYIMFQPPRDEIINEVAEIIKNKKLSYTDKTNCMRMINKIRMIVR